MKAFVTADLHFNHAAIVDWRGFASLEEMNELLVERWNETVAGDDIVYCLGDIAMGSRVESLRYVERLNGYIFLIPGNHDHVHPMHLKKKSPEWGAKWKGLYHDAGMRIGDQYIKFGYLPPFGDISYAMCHFPYEGDHTDEERYLTWRPERTPEVDILLHGHIHDMWKVNGNQVNVGVDVWGWAPVQLEVALQAGKDGVK